MTEVSAARVSRSLRDVTGRLSGGFGGRCARWPQEVAADARRVEVEWLDSMSEGRWIATERAVETATREAMLHRSVGYLIHETDDLVLLAGSRSEGGENVADTMQIPRVAVLNIHDLRGPK